MSFVFTRRRSMAKKNSNVAKTEKRKNYMGLSYLILSRVIPVLMIIVFVCFFIIYKNIKTSYTNQIVDRMNSECGSVTNKVEVWSNEARAILNTIADQLQGHFLGDNNNYAAYMQQHHTDVITGSDGVYLIYNDEYGTTVSYAGNERFPDYLTEDWFQFGLKCDEAAFDKCSFYDEDGVTDYTVTCAKNIKDVGGNVIGMAATDLTFSSIRGTIAEESEKLNASFLLIDDKSGMVIAASEDEYAGLTLQDATDPFLKDLLTNFDKNTSNKIVKTSQGKYVLTISNVGNTEWYLMLYEDYNTAYGALTRLLFILNIAALVIFCGIALSVGLTVSRKMKQLKRATSDIIEISKGNLTLNFDTHHKGPDNEITDINTSLHDYIIKMNSIISDVRSTAEGLNTHSTEFNELATGMNESTLTEKNSLEDLASEMQNINDSIQNLSADSEHLSRIAEETADSSSDAKNYMETVRSDSEETADNLNKVTEKMHVAQSSINELVSHVSDVESSAEQISSITSVIKGIASQTNLLSLNASIEAARAGEAGRGFAVVAEEIKQLADTSNENAGMIENLVSNISDLMSKTGSATRKSAEDIAMGVEILETIVESYSNTVVQVQATSERINKMLENAQKVDEISGRMAEATTVQAKGTETILMSAREIENMVAEAQSQSAKLQEGAEYLKEISDSLQEQMEFFKVQ